MMSAVRYQGFSSQQAVGDKLHIDRATMVAIVDDLESEGLITRRRDLSPDPPMVISGVRSWLSSAS